MSNSSPSGTLQHLRKVRKAETLFPPEPCVFVPRPPCGTPFYILINKQKVHWGNRRWHGFNVGFSQGARGGASSSVMSLVTTRVTCSPASLVAECQDNIQMLLRLPFPPKLPLTSRVHVVCSDVSRTSGNGTLLSLYPLPLCSQDEFIALSSFYPLKPPPTTFVPVSSCCRLFLMKIFQSQLKPLSAVWYQHFVFSCVIVLSFYFKLTDQQACLQCDIFY